MDTLPIDTSHPAVRDYLALIRLQVLTPLSLLLNIATLLVCALVASPSIRGVAHLYPTAITPKIGIIEAYIFVIWLTQIGYCVLLVGARKPETKATLIKGVGLTLPIANLLLGLWAIAWIMKWFLAGTIFVGLIILVLLYSNTVLLVYHAPNYSTRPFDALLIHAPMRFFLVLPLNLLFALSLFITLHMNYKPTPTGPPPNYSAWHAGAGAGVVAGSNILALLVVVLRRDLVWCIAAVWINVSLWSSRVQPPAGVNITAILFTAILPLALIAAYVYTRFCSGDRNGQIRLIGEEGARSPPNGASRSNGAQEPINGSGPREVDDTWG